MARVNVYLPDDLASEAKAANLNVSGLTQDAIRSALAAGATDGWLERVAELHHDDIPHEAVLAAMDAARDELDDQ